MDVLLVLGGTECSALADEHLALSFPDMFCCTLTGCSTLHCCSGCFELTLPVDMLVSFVLVHIWGPCFLLFVGLGCIGIEIFCRIVVPFVPDVSLVDIDRRGWVRDEFSLVGFLSLLLWAVVLNEGWLPADCFDLLLHFVARGLSAPVEYGCIPSVFFGSNLQFLRFSVSLGLLIGPSDIVFRVGLFSEYCFLELDLGIALTNLVLKKDLRYQYLVHEGRFWHCW